MTHIFTKFVIREICVSLDNFPPHSSCDIEADAPGVPTLPGAPNYGKIKGVTKNNYCYFDHY